jgi:hypothetical protein
MAFIELSTMNLLPKKLRCQHFLKPRYMQSIKAFQTFFLYKIRLEVALSRIFFSF